MTGTPTVRVPGPAPGRFLAGLGVITLGAAALRAWVVLVQRPSVEAGGDGYVLAGDAVYYHWQGRALAAGRGFVSPFVYALEVDGVDPTSSAWPEGLDPDLQAGSHPPLYPLYLALWSRLGVTTVTGHRLASSLLGVATVVLVALLARRLAGDRAGLIAGAIAAVYPQLWINDGMLMSETVAAFATVLMLLAVHRFRARPSLPAALAIGAGTGLAVLARAELVLLFALVVLPLLVMVRGVSKRRRVALAVATAAAALAVLGPWVGHNLTRFREPVLLSNGTGAVLSAGACDEVFSGSLVGYHTACFDGPWPGLDADESERDRVARDDAFAYLREHWTRVPVVAAARVGRTWGMFKPGQTTELDWTVEGRGEVATRLGAAGFYLLLPFALAGGALLRHRRDVVLGYAAIAVAVTAVSAVAFGLPRYRVPLEVAICVLAGVAGAALAAMARAAPAAPRHPSRPGAA